MLQEKLELIKTLTETPFPNGADIRITILGLAYCQLTAKKSQINFLSHVPYHKLDLMIYQGRRGSTAPSLLLDTRVDINHTISIRADSSVTPPGIESKGDHPLSELINISQLHYKDKIIKYRKDVPSDKIPIKLVVYDCRFYTQLITTDNYDIIETIDGKEISNVGPKKIGYVMGGGIECRAGGNLEVQVKGSNPTNIVCPLKDAEGDFIYDIILNNHCIEMSKCESEIGSDGDFKYYYDVLQDPEIPTREFKLRKTESLRGTDVAACNVVITEPPTNVNP